MNPGLWALDPPLVTAELFCLFKKPLSRKGEGAKMLSTRQRLGFVLIWKAGSGVCRRSLSNKMETGNGAGTGLSGAALLETKMESRHRGTPYYVLLTAKTHSDSPGPSSDQRPLLFP